MDFDLVSSFKPTGDQPQAIEKIVEGIEYGLKNQTLLGVTGSGKTYTMANVIKKLNVPALIISHNKTLAGQLYQEMRDFFPNNAVSYFVSYYDYYQPEAYVPQTDTYIEKEAEINDLIDKLRLASTTNILTRQDTIVVASVSCIYNIGSPSEYGRFILDLSVKMPFDVETITRRLVELQYDRSEFEFKRGSFRVRGNYLDVYPAYEDYGFRVFHENGTITSVVEFEPLTGKESGKLDKLIVYPAKHYLTDKNIFLSVEEKIRADLAVEYQELKNQKKLIEAERLLRKVNYDLELIKEVGYVNGIENYSRYFDGRAPGDPPYSLIDYFKKAYGKNFITIIDESHMTVPQLRGMFNGDFSRKKTLVEFGFRLKAAFDNRPLKFDEFYSLPPHLIYVSATPDEWEVEMSKNEARHKNFTTHNGVVEQLIRPTGIVDPEVEIRPSISEVQDLVKEIENRVKKKEKILVTTLTKKTAEDLTDYLKEKNVKASYLHSDIHTLERSDILDDLRKSEYDVLIGVNLLREGLDLPEVSLVAILDADKEGFLRSRTSLIQTMGRAARNIEGHVIIYADRITRSIKASIEEIERRRTQQLEYNKQNNITPTTIKKPVRERIIEGESISPYEFDNKKSKLDSTYFQSIKGDSLTSYDRKKVLKVLEREMQRQAELLNFEEAIRIRDKIRELKSS